VKDGRFRFEQSLAASDAERANPWLILDRDLGTDIVPAITDANSLAYVLHRKLGDDIVVDRGERQVRLRIMAALADSIFQSELVISDRNFAALFPEQQGYRRLFVDAPAARGPELITAIDRAAADFGADAIPTSDRLAEFHRVENTYLSTFQMLGGLGLLVGTVGLAAVLLRNVLERRRELALLAAVGYRRSHLIAIVLAENLVLLACGVAIGIFCALVAIAPVMAERGGRLPAGAAAWLLVFSVLATGTISSVIATAAALGAPLLQALRSE
jgi:ABC-type antimicrobial peptide transport system permease subunit